MILMTSKEKAAVSIGSPYKEIWGEKSHNSGLFFTQIGRASCRERVLMPVYISVVAV